ncbi:alpha-crystallin A chain-like [Artemia franciscana]|uniref:SHSP domain-containing protein n=1 Tax=Artemia franciscana TaxID=6661 RepID=A0AA88LEZ3_ARTSF|nr:hypothetical protein QYM36_002440 [Artemia franciscana]
MNNQQGSQVSGYMQEYYKDENRPVKIYDCQLHANNDEGLYQKRRFVPYGRRETGVSEFKVEKDKFVIFLDVQQFSVDEVTVRACDGYLKIEALQEEKEDEYGLVQRQLSRKYFLPEGTDTDQINAFYTTDAFIFVCGSRQAAQGNATRYGDRVVQVNQSGQPAVTFQQSQQAQFSKKK